MGTRHCFGGATNADPGVIGDCRQGGLGWTGGSETWQKAGTATQAAALITALALVVLAAGAAAGKSARLPAGTSAVGAATSLAMGAMFVSMAPAIGGTHMDRGVWLFGAGLAAAVIAALAVLGSRGATPAPT